MKSCVIENKTVFAGTKDEFVSYVAERIFQNCQKKTSEFNEIDFASVDCEVNEYSDMNLVYEDASSWCGIKAIPWKWFEPHSYRQYVADYYNGGCFGTCDIFIDDMDIGYVKQEVLKMLAWCLDESGSTIVWETDGQEG